MCCLTLLCVAPCEQAIRDRAFALVKRFQPDFPVEQIVFYQEDYGEVSLGKGHIKLMFV